MARVFFALMVGSWLLLMGTAIALMPWQAGQAIGFVGLIIFGLATALSLAWDRIRP